MNDATISRRPGAQLPGLRAWSGLVSWIACAFCSIHAGEPGMRIERNHLSVKDAGLIKSARALTDGGRSMSKEQVIAAMKTPSPAPVMLLPVAVEPLEPRVIAERARKALMRVGWFLRCAHCDQWHVNLSGGYVISPDGVVVTCWHCIAPERQDAREAHLIAFDADRHAYAVTAVLAYDQELDAAVIRVDASGLPAVAINDRCTAGDPAYVFSDPLEISGYFSAGLVNRCFWKDDKEHPNANSLADVRQLRVNVSADWAPGSSGAAVLDACGNAIAHVEAIDALNIDGASQTSGVTPKKPKKGGGDPAEGGDNGRGTVMVLHEAVPARGVRLLVDSMGATGPARQGTKPPTPKEARGMGP